MRFYPCSAFALLVASLLSTPALADECESAWEHMKEVSRKELAGEPANVRDAAKISFSDEARALATPLSARPNRGQLCPRQEEIVRYGRLHPAQQMMVCR